MRLAVEASIVRSMGSKSQVPALPLVAEVLIWAWGASATVPLELVSMKPPLPEIDPPIDLRMPATVVLSSDQMAIVPPLPVFVAEVSTRAFCSTLTVFASWPLLAA